MTKDKKLKLPDKKTLIILVTLIILIYFSGLILFSFKTYPRTKVNGINKGLTSTDDFYNKHLNNKVYSFVGREGDKLDLHIADIKAEFPIKGEAPDQTWPIFWPIEIFKRHDYKVDYDYVYDEDRLDYLIRESGFNPEGRPAKDAHIVIEDDEIKIQKEDLGKKADLDLLKKLILDSLGNEETNISVDKIYSSPTVFADDPKLQKKLEDLKKILTSQVFIKVGDTEYKLDKESLYKCLDEGDSGYLINDAKLRDWVRDIARDTDTYGTTRTFDTTGAGRIEVPPGIYGWRMDVDETLVNIKTALAENKNGEVEVAYKIRGLARGELNDIGDTYIEIDLSRQHLWAYKDGNLLMDSPVKTGMHNGQNETPRGVNMIWSREKGKVLKGVDMTGSRYESPVQYWMPVNYAGIGLHDADWVSKFGGTEYLYRGSNGCINLPFETAKTIYDNYGNRTPVVLYESTTDYSPAEKSF